MMYAVQLTVEYIKLVSMKIFHCTLIVDECITHTALKHIFLFTIFLFLVRESQDEKLIFGHSVHIDPTTISVIQL